MFKVPQSPLRPLPLRPSAVNLSDAKPLLAADRNWTPGAAVVQ